MRYYFYFASNNSADFRAELESSSAEELRRYIFNQEYNTFISKNCDIDKHEVKGGKSIPYIGWFWRSCDFYNGHISIGHCGAFIGVMENNKWDYPERRMTKDEVEKFMAFIDSARSAGGSVEEAEEKKWKALRELWDWMQTLHIDGKIPDDDEDDEVICFEKLPR